jgi:hypothetical protein
MKKVALSLLALAVVAAGAFADAPKWDPKVSTEFKGAASVTLGYDVDTGISAFSNDTSVSLIIDLISGGDKSTTSDADVWGEIRIKTDGDPVRIKADDKDSDATTAYDNGFKLQVDFAKIHFGKSAYLSVTSKDTQIGYANSPDLAFVSKIFTHTWIDTSKKTDAVAAQPIYANADGTGGIVGYIPAKAATVGTANYTRYGHTGFDDTNDELWFVGTGDPKFPAFGPTAKGGLEVGYSLEKVASIAVVVGSTDAWGADLVNTRNYSQIAYKATVGLLAVDNLTLEAGYSASTLKDDQKALGAKVAYKYAIDGDKLYVKPLVGLTQHTPAGASAKAYNVLTGSLLIGTGAKAATFDNYGLKLDNDFGGYPGVSVGALYSDYNAVYELGEKKAQTGLNVSVNSGSTIPDLTLVAAYDILDLNAKDVTSNATVGFSTSIKNGDVTISPKGVVSSFSSKGAVAVFKDGLPSTADSSLFAKVTVDFAGLIPFVTFTVNYESNDLVNGYGVKNDKNGKVELTTKVAF